MIGPAHCISGGAGCGESGPPDETRTERGVIGN